MCNMVDQAEGGSTMRILTYPNPFELKSCEFWHLITAHPHFCASDTLVQGLSSYYGREAFKTLRPIQDLLKAFFAEYVDDPMNDMRMFLTVADAIRKWPDGEIKQSFLFNKADIVRAIQFLLPLNCETSKFDRSRLSREQCGFLDVLQIVRESSSYESLKACQNKTRDDYEDAIDLVNIREIEYQIKRLLTRRDDHLREVLNLRFPIKDQRTAIKAATDALRYLESETVDDFFAPPPKSSSGTSLRIAMDLCQKQSDSYYDTIIIHGIHQITPIMYLLFNKLEELGIQVIFLINYANNFPKIYQTWKNVYNWCETIFEYTQPIEEMSGKEIGQKIADTLENAKTGICKESVVEYETMTSFAIREVGVTYQKAYDKVKSHDSHGSVLQNMKKQYYAVRGQQCNEILRMYYPEQFREKPFLSYPIGQFILGIYQMWDFDTNQMKINPTSLSECVVSGVFNPPHNLLETIKKLELLFSDIESFPDYMERIQLLEQLKSRIVHGDLDDWRILDRVSFFNISPDELEGFKNYLIQINKISNMLFSDISTQVDYLQHFRRLIDLISTPEISENAMSSSEKELIQEITTRLTTPSKEEIIGNTMDLRDALAFFLSGRLDSDSSNWIVRDFTQIDGAVLLSGKGTKANTYHFGLMSNNRMTTKRHDDLPWPLTEEMFCQYTDIHKALDAVTAGYHERRSFFKYILFYGAYFSRVDHIVFSYIREESGENQIPYYLFTAMGMKVEKYDGQPDRRMIQADTSTNDAHGHLEGLTEEQKEMFSVCRFKYLINQVLKAPIEYKSEFQIKYYLSFALAYVTWFRMKRKKTQIGKEMDLAMIELRQLFPFWGEVVFADIRARAEADLEKYCRSGKDPMSIWYVRRKKNYLLATWKENEGGKDYIAVKTNTDELWKEYFTSTQIYPPVEEIPPTGVCSNCSYSEICLRDFYDAHIEGDM